MDTDFSTIRRALLSVSDKSGLVSLARRLHERRVELIATGGTARALRQDGLPITDVAEITGFPELMDGRLKTLHPLIHGALLARRDDHGHQQAMREHGIRPIDLLVVNLYPFEETRARTSDGDILIETIDIGGPAMIRAAAKNHAHVCVLTAPWQYAVFLEEIRKHNGTVRYELRRHFAALAYEHTCRYDAAISKWMDETNDNASPLRNLLPFDRLAPLPVAMPRSAYGTFFESDENGFVAAERKTDARRGESVDALSSETGTFGTASSAPTPSGTAPFKKEASATK